MKILLIAGEVSGDHHGAALINEFKKQVEEVEVYGIGGDELASAGMDIMYHTSQMAFLGVGEIIRHLPFIHKALRSILDRAESDKPDCAILIDYPGFNMKAAAGLHKLGIPVIYYISPQLWAWGRHRIKKIKKYVDRMLVLFPFEEKFYQEYEIDATCVGHPLVDKHIEHLPAKDKEIDAQNIKVGLLPGSREQEVRSLLPLMIQTVRALFKKKAIHYANIIKVNHLARSEYEQYLTADDTFISIKEESLQQCLPQFDAALVASGTATLETGYFATPMVVVYRVNKLTYWLGRLLVKVPFIGLVNIVAETQVAVELIQHECTVKNMTVELEKLLDPETNLQIRSKLRIIRDKLGLPGASRKAARDIIQFLGENSDKTI